MGWNHQLVIILLMEESGEKTTWDGHKTLLNSGIDYQPQLVNAGFAKPSTVLSIVSGNFGPWSRQEPEVEMFLGNPLNFQSFCQPYVRSSNFEMVPSRNGPISPTHAITWAAWDALNGLFTHFDSNAKDHTSSWYIMMYVYIYTL